MLNKLFYYKNKKKVNIDIKPIDEKIIHQLACVFNTDKQSLDIKPLQGGTLGIIYRINLLNENKKYILKTHLNNDTYKQSLINEFKLLKEANIKSFYSELVLLRENQFGILMEQLEKPKIITPPDILRITNQLKNFSYLKDKNFSYTFNDLINTALSEAEILSDNSIISANTYNIATENINNLYPLTSKYEQVICHGDLSNKNIMCNKKGDFVIIDFEDSFIGPEGYDYLYWLTFFSNRNFYTPDVFRKTNLDKNDTKAILLLVLILKAAISFYSESYKTNTISNDKRINEILNYLD